MKDKSEAPYRVLFDHIKDAVFIATLEGKILVANDEACARLGYSREEFLELSPALFDSPRFKAAVPKRLAEIMDRGHHIFESAHLRRDGTEVPVEVNARLCDLDGRRAILAVCRDISDRKRLEAEQQALQQQLHRAQRLETVGRLAGGLAHDFNNLLTTLLGNAELLAEELEGTQRQQVDEIALAAEQAALLTRRLLAFSRRQPSAPQLLDLKATIERLRPLVNRLIEENIQLRWELADELGSLRADPGQVEQIVVNLVVNARDAMPNGGTLTISGQPGDDDHVVLTVTDEGVGLPEAKQSKIFEPFFTTREGGTGLGLWTVKDTVEQLGGRIELRSQPGAGTTFAVSLPSAAGTAPGAPAVKPAEGPAGGTERVLVVEDAASVRRIAVHGLSRLGYRVFAAAGGPEALALVASLDEPPDLLVTDVLMPQMSGIELARELRQRWPGLKVIYASGWTAEEQLDADDDEPMTLLSKPYGPRALATLVRELLDRAG